MNLTDLIAKYSVEIPKCKLFVAVFETPIGKIMVGADNVFLYFITFLDSLQLQNVFYLMSEEIKCEFVFDKNEVLTTFENELTEYFSGNLMRFSSPIKMLGSNFQNDVWKNMQNIPYAETQSYGGLAMKMGKSSKYSRAVGSACGANKHLLVVPCHRVVASNSKGGFSCGIDRKKWLLEHELKYKNNNAC